MILRAINEAGERSKNCPGLKATTLKHKTKLKTVITTLAVSLLISLLVSSASMAKTVTVTDAMGRQVVVQVPVKRAVFLIGYELVPYLDLWDQTVGISLWAKRKGSFLREVGEERLAAITSVGTASQVNLESLALLAPDLVITWRYRPETIKAMETAGGHDRCAVIAISPEGLKDLRSTLVLVARLFGKEKRLHRVNKAMDTIFSLVDKRVSGLKETEKRRVLWLWGNPSQVAGRKGVVPDLIRMAGGRNCVQGLDLLYPRISPEQIVLWAPEVIFIWGNAGYGPEAILSDSRFSSVPAVKNKAVYKAPDWSTWSPRAALVCLWMAMKIYPERFQDILFNHAVDEFDRQIFF